MADDTLSLDEILSGTPEPVVETAAAPEPEIKPEPVRDEQGRFAPKDGEAQPQPTDEEAKAVVEGAPKPQTQPHGFVPQQALDEERQKRRDLEARIAALERPPQAPAPATPDKPKPTLWDSPDDYLAERLTPLQRELAETRMFYSGELAKSKFGEDTCKAAYSAMQEAVQSGKIDPNQVEAFLSKSRDPVGDIVRWHQNRPEVQAASMREQIKAEVMKELGIDPNKPAEPAPSSTPSAPVINIPQSLSKIPGNASAAADRDESLTELLGGR